jgi:hypothetical protein
MLKPSFCATLLPKAFVSNGSRAFARIAHYQAVAFIPIEGFEGFGE